MMLMKWFVRLALTAACGVSILSAADVQLIEEIIAKVNGDIITRGEIARQRRQIEAELRGQGNVPASRMQQVLQEREKDILRQRIDQLLLVQKGKELHINVDQDFSKYQAPCAGDPLTVTCVAAANARASVILADRYAMIGMPTP